MSPIPLVQFAIGAINAVVHSFGWSMVLLAVIVRVAFWKLNARSAKAMSRTQRTAPKLKALRSRFKDEPEALSRAMMALYQEEGINPLSGILPQLVQIPIVISVYWAVLADKSLFAKQHWLWIGSPLAARVPWHLLAANLASMDCVLLVLYVASMYLSIRSVGIQPDPQAARQQRVMAVMSPAITGFFGFKYAWPSAMLLYWLTANLMAVFQQRLLMAAAVRETSAYASSLPLWLAIPRDYVLFFIGKAYPKSVNVEWARWTALCLFVSAIFAILTQTAQEGSHGNSSDPLGLCVAAVMTCAILIFLKFRYTTSL